MAEKKHTVDLTTGIGTFSFPHVFEQTKSTNDKGETVYDIQFIIPKSQREDVKAIIAAIKEVGEAKWGDKWKQVRAPLRDGDKEKDDLTEDGTPKGEKYPERLGCYFMNARSYKPVSVVDRTRTPITNPDDLYGGSKGKLAVTFYPYSQQGNHGIGCSLNGVQKVADGEPFGNARPSVESMFDMLEDEEDPFNDDLDSGLDDEVAEPKASKKAKGDKGKKAKKKAAA